MTKKIVARIKLVDYGDFHKWDITLPSVRITSAGFTSNTGGLKELKECFFWFKIKKAIK